MAPFDPYRWGQEVTDLVELSGDGSSSVTVEEVQNTADQPIDLATEQTVGEIAMRVGVLLDALQMEDANDQIRVDLENNNAGTISVSLEGVNGPASEETLAQIADSLQTEDASDQIRVDLENNNAGTLTVSHEGVSDPLDGSDMTAVSDTTSATGSGSAAGVDLGDHRTAVSVGWDVSGAAQITVEGSNDGSTWHPIRRFNPGAAEIDGVDLSAGWSHVRVYADANVNDLSVSGKGV